MGAATGGGGGGGGGAAATPLLPPRFGSLLGADVTETVVGAVSSTTKRASSARGSPSGSTYVSSGRLGSGHAWYSATAPARPGARGPDQKRTRANAWGAFTTSCQGRHSTARNRCGPGGTFLSVSGRDMSSICSAGWLSTTRCACAPPRNA